jgi:hypothetical protein
MKWTRSLLVGVATVAAIAAAVGLATWLSPSANSARLEPRAIAVDAAATGPDGSQSLEKRAQVDVARHSNSLILTARTPDPLTAYADCKAAELFAKQFKAWDSQGDARIARLNEFLAKDGGVSDLHKSDITNCHDTVSGLDIPWSPAASPMVHAAAIRLSLWHLVPLSESLVTGRVRAGDVAGVQRAFKQARSLRDQIEGHWAAYRRLTSDPTLGQLKLSAEAMTVETAIETLLPAAAIASEAPNNHIDARTASALARRLVRQRVHPWIEVAQATRRIGAAYEEVRLQADAILRSDDHGTLLNSGSATPIVLGAAADHCIVGEWLRDSDGRSTFALHLLVAPDGSNAANCDANVAPHTAGPPQRRFNLGLEYVNARATRDGALLLPRGPRPALKTSPAARAGLLSALVVPQWAREAGSQWRVSGDALTKSLQVQVSIQIAVPSLNLSVPFSLSLGQGASSLQTQSTVLMSAIRRAVNSLDPEHMSLPRSPLTITALRGGQPWTRTDMWIEADATIGGVGHGTIRLELHDGALSFGTQTLGEEWRASLEQAGTKAIRTRLGAVPNAGGISAVLVDGRLEESGNIRATLRISAPAGMLVPQLPDAILTVDRHGLAVEPATGGGWSDLATTLGAELKQTVATSAAEYARALIARGFSPTLAGLSSVARSANGDCEGGFDLVLNESAAAIHCVVALSADAPPRLSFSRARLVDARTGAPIDAAPLVLSALGMRSFQGQLHTSVPTSTQDGLRFSVFLDGVPRLHTVALGEVQLGPSAPAWKSDLRAQFQTYLTSQLKDIIPGVLRDQFERITVTDVRLDLSGTSAILRTDLVATLSVSGFGDVEIPVTARWLPAFALEAGQPSQQFAAVVQNAIGPLLGKLLGTPDNNPRITLDPLGVVATPRVTLGGASFALTVNLTKDGPIVQTPIEVPLGMPIHITPIAIVHPRIRINDARLQSIGIRGDVTAASEGVDAIAKISATLDLGVNPLQAAFSGDLILASTVPIASVRARLNENDFRFQIATSEAISNVLALRGDGGITHDEMYMRGSLAVLGVTIGDAYVQAILCSQCPDSGRVLARGDVTLLLGHADASIEMRPFPNNVHFSSMIDFQVDRFQIAGARIRASDEEASIELTAAGIPLTVSGRSLADLSPARVLEAILAIFKMDPQKLLDALRQPSFSLGEPVGPRSNGGDRQRVGTPGSSGGATPSTPAPWPTENTGSGGGGSEQPMLFPGMVPVKFSATNVGDCIYRTPVVWSSTGLIPTSTESALKTNLGLIVLNGDVDGEGAEQSIRTDSGPINHLWFPTPPGGIGGDWQLTLTRDGHLDAVRLHVARPCGTGTDQDRNVVRLPLLPSIMTPDWTWQQAREGIDEFRIQPGDAALFRESLVDTLHGGDRLRDVRRLELNDGLTVYKWTQQIAGEHEPRVMLLPRSSNQEWSLPASSLIASGIDTPEVRDSWRWFQPIVNGLRFGLIPDYVWPSSGVPRLLQIGVTIWDCPQSSSCLPIRMLTWPGPQFQPSTTGRFDPVLKRVADVVESAPPTSTDSSTPARAVIWLGLPPGASSAIALYSPDLAAPSYRVYVIDATGAGAVSGDRILAEARVRTNECGTSAPVTLATLTDRLKLILEIGLPTTDHPRCASPWFFWRSLRNP